MVWRAARTTGGVSQALSLELSQYPEEFTYLRDGVAERPVTLLFSARDPVHNGAVCSERSYAARNRALLKQK